MFWPIIPIMTVTGMQVVIQPLPLSIWKLPFHAIKVMRSVQPASCSSMMGGPSSMETHSSNHLTMVATWKSSVSTRRQQHTDLEFWAVAHLIMHVFRILKFSWYVCYLQLLINVVDLSETYAIREIILVCICHE